MTARYAIEATCLADRTATGIARYARNLILQMSALSVPPEQEFELTQLYRSSRLRRRQQLPEGPRLSRQMWRNQLWPMIKRYDLLHTPDHRLPHWKGIPKVVTVHDVYSVVGVNFQDPLTRSKQNAIYEDFARRADYIVFDSAHSRTDFLTHFSYRPERTAVVHLGVGEEFYPRSPSKLQGLRERYALSEPFLLFLGLQNPNKNLNRLLEAFSRSAAHKDFLLLLAGAVPADQRALLQATVDRLGLHGRVLMPGYVAEADVAPLYAAASALLLPSIYEGFGLPILEAMASGTPVLTSNLSSCPEVAAGHAVLVDPYSVEAMASGIEQAVVLDQTRRDAARAYAATKTWCSTAQQTLAAYQAALKAA